MGITTGMNARRADADRSARAQKPSALRSSGGSARRAELGITPPGGILALQRFIAKQPAVALVEDEGEAKERRPPAELLQLQQLIKSPHRLPAAEQDGSPLSLKASSRSTAAPQSRAIQRFQAGEEGHGTLTEEELREAGLGNDGGTQNSGFIGQAYFGNWLRDFAQVGSTRSPALLNLLNVIAIGEFNRPLDPNDLGAYLPSEHADNPRGGGSAEDPLRPASQAPDGKDRITPRQSAALAEEATPEFKEMLRQKAQDSHLPEYIEAAKAFARREFFRAARTGRNSDGALALGSGLHTVQDYFSHSNFTDASLALLVAEGAVPANVHPYVALLRRSRRLDYDPTGGILRGEKRPEIFSGTYRSAGNKEISILETLLSEVKNGSLRKAAVLGSIRLGIKYGGELGNSIGSRVGGTLGGSVLAVGGALVEGAKGAYDGVKQGFELGRAVSPSDIPAAAVGLGVYQGLQGVGRGLRQGYALGSEAGGKYGKSAGTAVGSVYGAAYAAEIIGGFVATLSVIIEGLRRTPGVGSALSDSAEAIEDYELRKSVANDQAQEQSLLRSSQASAPAQAYTGPNHSQLSKDDTSHPLFYFSRVLSRVAGVALAKAMVRAWETHGDQRSLDELAGLVDFYVSHPSYSDWWREPLKTLIASRSYSAPQE